MIRVSLILVAVLGTSVAGAEAPWPAKVKGHVEAKPGEHPRLFFRKADLPALKKKAQTPEGKAIIARLKALLGGGEAMPTRENDAKKAYDKKKPLPEGGYTIGHAAGFGMLYQLTGDRKYADLGRKCFERAWAGVRDRDDRYSWTKPGGALRAGPSVGIYAIGYDLSGASGADALLVMVGGRPGKLGGGAVALKAGGHTFTVLTLQKGKAPEAKAKGDAAVVGGQSITYDGKKLVLAK